MPMRRALPTGNDSFCDSFFSGYRTLTTPGYSLSVVSARIAVKMGRSMISRIILENYMSHGRTVIEPASGLTVLVGPNNCGKSAIIHALQAICYNKPNEFAISHDQKEASVTLETDDGHVLTWRRKRGGSASYEIDGEPSYRLGQGGVPDALHAIVRMPKVEFADQPEFDVHFGLQKSPLFLLGDSPARAAAFFASSSDTERLLQMQRRHREKVRDARRESAQVCREIEKRDATLSAMAPLPRLLGEVAELESSHAAIEATDSQRSRLSNLLDRLRAARWQHDRRTARARAIEPLRPPPQYLQTAPLAELIEKIRQTDRRRASLVRRLTSLSVLQSPPTPHDTTRLASGVKAMQNGMSRVRRQAAIVGELSSLRSPPAQADVARLKLICESLERMSGRATSIASSVRALKNLSTPPTFADALPMLSQLRAIAAATARQRRFHARMSMLTRLTPPPEVLAPATLQSAIGRYAQVSDKARQFRESLADLDVELQTVRDDSRRWAEDNPQCPTCGATTNAELALAGGNAHEH